MSQPLFSHSARPMRVSNHRHERGFQNSIEQMVAFGYPAAEFLERHDQGIDLAPQAVLSSGDIFNDILETHFSDNEQVNIAFRAGPAASEGAIQESDGDASGQRLQRRPEHIHNAGCLGNKAFQLIKNGALRISLEQNLVFLDRAKDKSCL